MIHCRDYRNGILACSSNCREVSLSGLFIMCSISTRQSKTILHGNYAIERRPIHLFRSAELAVAKVRQ